MKSERTRRSRVRSHLVLEDRLRQGGFQAASDRVVHQATVRLGPQETVHLPLFVRVWLEGGGCLSAVKH